MKRHLRPPCTPFERPEEAMAPPCLHSPVSLCILFYTHSLTRCRLQCVTIININYQRSPETEQSITEKISGNALKQGSRTRSVLRQRSSQLQKYNAAPMSRRIADDQNVCGGDGRHPGLIAGP